MDPVFGVGEIKELNESKEIKEIKEIKDSVFYYWNSREYVNQKDDFLPIKIEYESKIKQLEAEVMFLQKQLDRKNDLLIFLQTVKQH